MYLMSVLSRMNSIRNKAEELAGQMNNSLIDSRNQHLKNMTGLYSFHIADFNKITEFLIPDKGSAEETASLTESIHSSLLLLDMMRHKLTKIH